MATRTISDAGGNWTETAAWAEGAVPTSADDVVATGTSGDLAVTTDVNCQSLNLTNYVGTLTQSQYKYIAINGQDGSGNGLVLPATMTYVHSAGSRIDLKGTGTTKITTNGIVLPCLYLNNSSGTFQLQDTLELNGGDSGNPTIYIQNSSTFDANSQAVIFSGSGRQWVRSAYGITFYDFTRTGTASKTDKWNLYDNATITVSNNLTITGNSAVNRLLVYSNTLGESRNITCNGTVTVTNADFRDITGAGSASWDLSAITGGSGDCKGNAGITFTTADDYYWHVDGGNISDYSHWYTATNGGGTQMASTRVPLPQDTLYFDLNSFDSGSQTVTNDMARIPGLDCTGVTNTPQIKLQFSNQEIYGSLTLVSGITFPVPFGTYFNGRGANTLTSAGHNFGTVYIQAVSGSFTLQDAYSSAYDMYINYGTFDSNEYNVSVKGFWSNNSNTRSIDLTNTTLSCSANGNTVQFQNSTNLSFTGTGSTIYLTDTSSSTKYFQGGNQAFNVLSITGGGSGIIDLRGTNSFVSLIINPPKEVRFYDGTTQTVSSLVATGTAVDGITLTGSGTGGWTISDSSGTNQVYYCTISYSTAQGGATWKASISDGNTDGGNNSGWDFSAVSTGNIKKVLGVAWANVKKINGIPKANIKKIAGVSAQ